MIDTRTVSDDIAQRIVALRDRGFSWKAISDIANSQRWPSARGGRWTPMTCYRVYVRVTGQTTERRDPLDDIRDTLARIEAAVTS